MEPISTTAAALYAGSAIIGGLSSWWGGRQQDQQERANLRENRRQFGVMTSMERARDEEDKLRYRQERADIGAGWDRMQKKRKWGPYAGGGQV